VREALADADAWIAATDVATEGTWVWITGEPFTFSNWAGGEPNNLGGEDCVQMYVQGVWNDLPCGAGQPALCEIPPPP
jgi:hypothetical protein